MHMLGIYILYISIIGSILVGLIVVVSNIKNTINQLYGILTTLFILFAIVNFLSLDPAVDQLLFMRLVMVLTTLIVALVYLFVRFISDSHKIDSWSKVFYAIPTLVVVCVSMSPLLFVRLAYTNSLPAPVAGPGMAVYLIHFFVFFALMFTTMHRSVKHGSAHVQSQMKLILIGVLPALVLSPVTGIILPQAFGYTGLIMFAPLYCLFFVACVGYAIFRHKLFDIRQAVVRTIAYILSLFALACLYFVTAYVISALIFRENATTGISLGPLNIALALLLAFIFQPIKNFFDRVTDKIFFANRYVAEDFYDRVSDVLSSMADLRGLLRRVAEEIGYTLKADQAFFFVRYSNNMRYVSSGTLEHQLLTSRDVLEFDHYVREKEADVVIRELLVDDRPEVYRLLTRHNIAIAVPLFHKGDILGYIFLGDRRSSSYTNRDIRVLHAISSELIIAIQHALSVQEVKDLNTHLQQRIDAATRELKASNTRLRHLDATKDEFLSMASHQLRTPLTSVKGYISMVLEGDAGKITDTQRQLLGEAFTSSERMVHLIHDFLNVSRLQTGKFTLERIPTDIVKLVRDEVASLKLIAESRSTQLVLHVSGDFPSLSVDAGKLRQVVMNYIDNALYYSQDTAKPITVMLTRVDNAVELRVVDNGMGVPKEEQAHLFGKFFRATNARKQRPDGTGVGLYLAKKVITEHGGDIIFLSEEGKGSTFGFRLPVDSLLATKHESQ